VDVLVSRLDEDEAAVREFQASEKPAG
jgi:hypothetical protein